MQYKTIVLQMLEDRPQLRQLLQQYHQLLPTLEFYAQELKTNHEAWEARLSQARPASDPSQIKSEAMELALAELEERLPIDSEIAAEPSSLETMALTPSPPSSSE